MKYLSPDVPDPAFGCTVNHEFQESFHFCPLPVLDQFQCFCVSVAKNTAIEALKHRVNVDQNFKPDSYRVTHYPTYLS